MAVIDSDQSFIAELTHDVERMKEGQKAYIQLALLYTSPTGRRMVRVHNLALNTTNAVMPCHTIGSPLPVIPLT